MAGHALDEKLSKLCEVQAGSCGVKSGQRTHFKGVAIVLAPFSEDVILVLSRVPWSAYRCR